MHVYTVLHREPVKDITCTKPTLGTGWGRVGNHHFSEKASSEGSSVFGVRSLQNLGKMCFD